MKTKLVVAIVVLVGLGAAAVVAAQGPAPAWVRINAPGFGDTGNAAAWSLAAFDGQLYAGTSRSDAPAQLWRRASGATWRVVYGFGSANHAVDHLLAFGGQLYAGTENSTEGGEIWRSNNGTSWTRVVQGGFGDETNAEIGRFAIFGKWLYAGTWSYAADRGAEVWRSTTGNVNEWQKVVGNGFGDAHNSAVLSYEVFKGYLFAGTSSLVQGDVFSSTGGEVWRSNDGTNWGQVNEDGFGTPNNNGVSALASFGNYLYASTTGVKDHGAQVWRCETCDGSDWTRAVSNGFGDPATNGMSALEVYRGALYFVVGNAATGMEVWRSGNGTDWEQVARGGFANTGNRAPGWDNSTLVLGNDLFIGTWNPGRGGEVWMAAFNRVFLPLIVRR